MNSESFLNIPEFVWQQIFNVAEVLAVGLVLGLFASKYQKRKEYEVKIKGQLLEMMLRGYERIAKDLYKLYSNIAPPLHKQALYDSLFNGMPFPVIETSYPSFMDSEKAFDDYYRNFNSLVREEKIFIDRKLSALLDQYTSFLSEIKMFLDAFVDTEHIKGIGLSAEESERNISLAYQCFGIALQQDFVRFYANFDTQIASRLRNVRLKVGVGGLAKKIDSLKAKTILALERAMTRKNLIGRIATRVYYRLVFRLYGKSQILANPSFLVLLLCYIHHSPRFSRDQFDELPESRRKQYMDTFHKMYISNLHYA